jgi:hypothetical protein
MLIFLNIRVSPPYIKPLETPVKEFGLPSKVFYTTAGICKVLNVKPDTLRLRVKHSTVQPVIGLDPD